MSFIVDFEGVFGVDLVLFLKVVGFLQVGTIITNRTVVFEVEFDFLDG